MIDIKPVSPGYVIHLSSTDEWDEIREYVRKNLKPGAVLSPTCDAVSLTFKDGKLVGYGKSELSYYICNSGFRDYMFVEFSDLFTDSADMDSIISAMSPLL